MRQFINDINIITNRPQGIQQMADMKKQLSRPLTMILKSHRVITWNDLALTV